MAGESTARIGIYADDKASATVKSVQGTLQKLAHDAKSSILTGIGLGAGVSAFNALSNAVRGTVGAVGDSIAAASKMAESQSKVNVVFGKSSQEITAWAETASDAFLMSTQQALEAAGTYGNLFQAFGIGREEATKMSMSLVELAADLASFNNTSVDDALIALRSGLSGETEPLKRYGIAISDARMRTELAAQGFQNLGATLTPLQKSTAAYGLIMQDSALAQGDVARTSGGLANQQKKLEAQLADVSTEVGEILLPVMQAFVTFLNDQVIPGLRDIVDWFQEAGDNATQFSVDLHKATGGLLGMSEATAKDLEQTEAFLDTLRELPPQMAPLGPLFLATGEAMGTGITEPLEAAKVTAVQTTADMLTDLAATMLEGQTDWEEAVEGYSDFLETNLLPAEEEAQILAQIELFTEKLVEAQASGDKEWIAEVDAVLETLRHRLRTGGTNIVTSFAAGMQSPESALAIAHALSQITNQISGVLAGDSPPKKGPLHEIDIWGENVGKAWAEGLSKGARAFNLGSLAPAGNRGAARTFGGPAMVGGGGLPDIHIYLDGRELSESNARWDYFSQSGGPARLPR